LTGTRCAPPSLSLSLSLSVSHNVCCLLLKAPRNSKNTTTSHTTNHENPTTARLRPNTAAEQTAYGVLPLPKMHEEVGDTCCALSFSLSLSLSPSLSLSLWASIFVKSRASFWLQFGIVCCTVVIDCCRRRRRCCFCCCCCCCCGCCCCYVWCLI